NRFRASVNVMAGTIAGLPMDVQFGSSSEDALCDLLLVEHAEMMAEDQFVALAARCRRWVLIAESTPNVPDEASPPATTLTRIHRGRNKSPAPSFFDHVWAR